MTTRIKADRTLCDGYANCIMNAPEHFDLDDDGKVVVLKSEVTDEDRPLVEAAVDSCPVSALRLEEQENG